MFLLPLVFIVAVGTACGTTAEQTCNNTMPHTPGLVDRLTRAIRYENGWTGCRYQHLGGHVTWSHCQVVLVTGEVAPVECGALDTAVVVLDGQTYDLGDPVPEGVPVSADDVLDSLLALTG